MSLYGDLPSAKDDSSKPTKGWASSANKLQPSLRKPAGVLAPPSSVLRAGGRGPGPAGRTLPSPAGRGSSGRGSGPAPVPAGAAAASVLSSSDGTDAALPSSGPIVVSALSFFSTHGEPIEDEYDPLRPNDYEDVLRGRDRKRKEAEEEAERVKRQREAELEAERRKLEQAEAVAAVLAAAKPPDHSLGPGMQPVKEEPHQQQHQPLPNSMDVDERDRRLKLSGEEAFAARARLSRRGPGGPAPGPGGPGGPMGTPPTAAAAAAATAATAAAAAAAGEAAEGTSGGPKGMGLAEKMLKKMGWREGEGLGRNKQGISTPLMAQKRGDHAAVIVNAPEMAPRPDAGEGGPGEKRPRMGASLVGTPSRVLVLRNMVGPGEVDEDLEEEVGMELSKYGQVLDVRIFEVLSQGYEPAEAVRIFIQFDRVDSAVKATIDLQGRFFGGKEVRVAFFPEDRFERQDLAPSAGEFGEKC